MSQPDKTLDADFESQLRGLFQQAERAMGSREAAEKPAAGDGAPEVDPLPGSKTEAGKAPQFSLPQLLKPVADGLKAVSRATTENTAILRKLESETTTGVSAHEELPKLVSDLRALLESKNTVSHNMFSALHDELKSYKDGFLLDSVHRPLIRDLVSLHDDTAELHRQVETALRETAGAAELCPAGQALLERLRTIAMNLEHHLEFIAEVLNRLEVTLLSPHTGKLDKNIQRAVAVELAEDPDDDSNVVRSLRPGVMWKDRLFRAEEVVVKKWKEGFLVALQTSA